MEIIGILGGLLLVAIAINLIAIVLIGAASIFGYASEQGFIGLAVCLACFVFMFPIMVAISVFVGWAGYREWLSTVRD